MAASTRSLATNTVGGMKKVVMSTLLEWDSRDTPADTSTWCAAAV